MMRHISHHLQEFDDAVLVGHFFHARGSGPEKTFLGLLRSLIYQLLSKDPEFYNAFAPIYREKSIIQRQWEWRQNELKNFLRSQLKHTKLSLIILVDALDECNLDEITSVVSFLEILSLDAVKAGTNLRICLSSRPYPNVSMRKNLEFTLDDNLEHDEDIKKYVRAELRSENIEIEEKIFRKADGVFLWVVLVVAMLNKAVEHGRPEDMQKKLDKIPSDLDKYFERIIFDDPERNPETLFMFQLVLFSTEPLEPAELVFAVIARFQEGPLKSRSRSDMTDNMLKARIVHSSKGLIEVSGRKGTVQFIHQTVTDFFLRTRRLERLYSTLEPDAEAASHDHLRACCLDYILKFPIDPQSHNGQSAIKLKYEYPFIEYSALNLLYHAEAALQGHQLGIESEKWMLSPDHWFKTWKRIVFAIGAIWYLHEDINVGLVYVLVCYAYHNVLAVVLKHGDVDVNIQGGIYNNALQLALQRHDDVATRLLLERGASVHLNGGYFGTVLQLATAQKNHGLVSMILEKGADLNASGGLFGTALQAAAALGNLQVLKILLKSGAEVNAYGGIFGNALQGAVHNGNLEGVKLLLEQGAVVNFEGGIYGSALHAAMERQKAEILQHLLLAGADVNGCGGIYGSWVDLNLALYAHHTNSYGQPIHSPPFSFKGTAFSLESGSAIIWAARNLDYDEVKLLLEYGADVNAASGPWESDVPKEFSIIKIRGVCFQYDLGVTALIWAARNGKKDMIELLLKYGADIETHSSSGETALLAGSKAGHEGVVRFLIDCGADISAKDSLGQNALYKAAAGGHVEAMRLLLHYSDFPDTYSWSESYVIKDTDIDIKIVDDRVSSILPNYQIMIPFRCLIMNGGFLYAGQMYDLWAIEEIQINGGICYFDMTNTNYFHIKKLQINGGSFYLVAHGDALQIDNLELSNGHISISADLMAFEKVSLLGGSLNCTSKGQFHASQVELGSTLSNSTGRQNIADSLSISGRSVIYVETLDGQMKQYGTAQSADQNTQISTMLSPLYVAAQNGHLEAVQLLLDSGAKLDTARHMLNPLDIARQNGHDEIVKLLQKKEQEAEEMKKNQKLERRRSERKQMAMRSHEKRKRRRDE